MKVSSYEEASIRENDVPVSQVVVKLCKMKTMFVVKMIRRKNDDAEKQGIGDGDDYNENNDSNGTTNDKQHDSITVTDTGMDTDAPLLGSALDVVESKH